MNTKAPIYRFASLRNPNSEYSSSDIEYVEIETQLISTLSEIVESDISKDEKLGNKDGEAYGSDKNWNTRDFPKFCV